MHPPCARPLFLPHPTPTARAVEARPGWAAFHLDDHIAFCGWEPCGFSTAGSRATQGRTINNLGTRLLTCFWYSVMPLYLRRTKGLLLAHLPKITKESGLAPYGLAAKQNPDTISI